MGRAVCVTGASGYIATWLVKLLLHHGYTVNATVRNLGEPSKVEHLRALDGATERLKLFEADLLEPGSFDSAIDGCDGVFHTASPVMLGNIVDPQKELMEPAVKGTLNVLSSCVKAPSVKRVVLTSSMASVIASREAKTAETVLDETCFSDPQFVEENKQWYILSKTLAEKTAIEFANKNGMDLLVINPGLVMGPPLQPTLNVTTQTFLDLMREGTSLATPGGIFLFVDVRDVVKAHVLAFESPSANGRYCVVADAVYSSQVLDVLHQLYPNLDFPKSSEEMPLFQVCSEKAKSLGVNFIPLEQSLKDTVESFKERKLI